MAANFIKKPNSISQELNITLSYLEILDTQNTTYIRPCPKKEHTKLKGNNLNSINSNYQHFYFPDLEQMLGDYLFYKMTISTSTPYLYNFFRMTVELFKPPFILQPLYKSSHK